MRQTATNISVYSADSFGVCSALYELGGLVVMHDPSGCNSTYTTHDEPRWYDKDSMIYISGLSEIDAIMGNDDKFIHDIIETAERLHPAFIALIRTPIPFMMGTDFPAIAKIIEEQTHIPTFHFLTSSMNSYVSGASAAFQVLAEKVVEPAIKYGLKGVPINVLGITPLDYAMNGSDASITKFLEDNGYDVVSSWSLNTSLDQIKESSVASVNLVVSYAGLAAAKVLKERFDIPYVVGVPIGMPMMNSVLQDLSMALITGNDYIAFAIRPYCGKPRITIIGESVYSESLAYAITAKTKQAVNVICPVKTSIELMDFKDSTARYEDEIAENLQESEIVIADPLYQPIVPKAASFVPLPHVAFSGRCFEKSIPNLIDDFDSFLQSFTITEKSGESYGLE